MKDADAVEVVAVLTAAFPNLTLEPDAARLWSKLISELDNAEVGFSVALAIARNSTRIPTIAEFRQAYTNELARWRQRHRQIEPPEPAGSREVPMWVRRWAAARYLHSRFGKEQDTRPFKEQHGHVDPDAATMPDDAWTEEAQQVTNADVWRNLPSSAGAV